jgi:riboflavin synthase
MFTGIITDLGRIASADRRGDLRVRIETDANLDDLQMGASVACSGVCLTAVEKGSGWFAIDVSDETVSRTASGMWQPGRRLNLERALRLGDELGGHIVTGHVDGIGRIAAMEDVGGSKRVTVAIPGDIAPFIAPKGSVSIDGVSLTVNEVRDEAEGSAFTVNIIPHTAAQTTFDQFGVGDEVNIEIDVLARYLKRMMSLQPS